MAFSPQVSLVKIGNGRKLHIPHGGRPLCEALVVTAKANPIVDEVSGDGATCQNCLKQAERISAYL